MLREISRTRTSRRIVLDRWASRLVILGGAIIIASILAILFVIVGEVWPLFRKPTATPAGTYAVPDAMLASGPAGGGAGGAGEYRAIAFAVTHGGPVSLRSRHRDAAAAAALGH